MDYLPLNEDQLRNLINAEATFSAREAAQGGLHSRTEVFGCSTADRQTLQPGGTCGPVPQSKADKTFRVREDQLQTAVNAKGFEVNVIRRMAKDGDPHLLRMSDQENDLWAVQVSSSEKMLDAARFSQVIVATDGSMARMTTMAPDAFVRVKEALVKSPIRDPLKRDKDVL